MELDMKAIGAYIREQRTRLDMTQAEMAERLSLSAQSVSNWERGETTPDVALLPDLAMILDCSIDELLGGGKCAGKYRRRVTVAQMREAIGCIRRMRELLGSDHFMYRTMVEALDQRMNSEIEPAFVEDRFLEAYICEALLACVQNGDYVDLHDVRTQIRSERPREYTIQCLKERGVR